MQQRALEKISMPWETISRITSDIVVHACRASIKEAKAWELTWVWGWPDLHNEVHICHSYMVKYWCRKGVWVCRFHETRTFPNYVHRLLSIVPAVGRLRQESWQAFEPRLCYVVGSRLAQAAVKHSLRTQHEQTSNQGGKQTSRKPLLSKGAT